MASEDRGTGFKIWGADNIVYGPVELPALVNWVKDERVLADTWVFAERDDAWRKAASLAELKMFFNKPATASPIVSPPTVGQPIRPGTMRRVKLLADFSDAQLERLLELLEVQQVPQWTVVVKQGDHGDAMFMVLEGELRVRLMISGKESILATLGPGEFFGEISLFDAGPRSADVVSNKDSTLLKVSEVAFNRLMKEAPDLAARFLLSTARTLTARIRADNRRYQDSVLFARAAQ